MAPSTSIVLYDIPSLLPERQGFSPFVNTVRSALQYKQLTFTTEYVEFVEVESECKRLGIPPTTTQTQEDGTMVPAYTLPGLLDSTSGKPIIISDSIKIIEYLETTYPDPARSLFPGLSSSENTARSASAVHLLADQQIMSALLTCFPWLAEDMHQLIPEPSKEYWRGTFLRRSGVSEWKNVVLQKDGPVYAHLAKTMVTAFAGIADALLRNTSGSSGDRRWLMGGRPTYADLKLRSVLNFVRSVSPDTWAHLEAIEGGLFEHYLAAWCQVI
jgi:glutathione S-transferase